MGLIFGSEKLALTLCLAAVTACGAPTDGGGNGSGDAGPAEGDMTGNDSSATGGVQGGGAGGEPVGGGGGEGGEPVGGMGGAGGVPVGGMGGAGGEPVGGSGGAGGVPVVCEGPPGFIVVAPVLPPVVEGPVTPPTLSTCEMPLSLNDSPNGDGTFSFTGSTNGAVNNLTGSCGRGAAPDAAFTFTAPTNGLWTLTTVRFDDGASFDTILYTRGACDDLEDLDCSDDVGSPQSALRVSLEAEQSIFVVVDGFSAESAGDFVLTAMPDLGPLPEGAPCDDLDLGGACDEGLSCADLRGHRGVCMVVGAPTISEASIVLSVGMNQLLIEVSGLDANHDVESLDLSAVDARGEPLDLSSIGLFPYHPYFDRVVSVDGSYSARTLVYLDEPADISVATVVVYDRRGLTSESFDVMVTAPAVSDLGGPCDPNRNFDSCAEGLLCDRAGPDPATPPTCSATDAGCDDGIVPIRLNDFADACGFSYEGSLDGAVDHTDTCGFDTAGDQVLSFEADAGDYVAAVYSTNGVPIVITHQTSCLVEDVAALLLCSSHFPGEDDGRPAYVSMSFATPGTQYLVVSGLEGPAANYRVVVYAAHAPTLDVAEGTVDAQTNSLGIRLVGADLDGDVVGLSMRILDAMGMPVLANMDGSPYEGSVPQDALQTGADGSVEIFLALEIRDIDFATLALLEVALLDATDRRSAVLTVRLEAPPALEPDAACRINEVFGFCSGDQVCAEDAADSPTGLCTVLGAACPAQYGEVIDLNSFALAGAYSYAGDTTALPSLTDGQCGGAGANDAVFTFTADVAGPYTFETVVDAGRDTVLYVRSHCGSMAPAEELACDDDSGDSTASLVHLELAALQTVYVFVDGYVGDVADNGPFVLNVTPPPAN